MQVRWHGSSLCTYSNCSCFSPVKPNDLKQGRPLVAMDIKREPPKKRGKYILIGVGVAVLGITTVALGNLEQRAPSVDRATLWIDSVPVSYTHLRAHET